jgi:ferredoxin--NADP+ reductase
VSQPVLDALMASKVREVHMIGRRGPAQAKFTTRELRELGDLAGVDVVVGDGEADLDAFDPTGESARLAGADRHVRGNYTVISGWAGRPPAGAARRLTLRFWLAPKEIQGTERVTGLTLERTRLDSQGRFTGTGELHTIDAQLVLRSVGYQSVPLPGLPFHDATHTVPHLEGRVIGPDGNALPGEYVAGWLKRGPTGVIGTNKSDAAETVRSLLADLAGGPGPGDVPLPRAGLLPMPAGPGGGPGADSGSGRLAGLLARRGIRPVSYADWLGIEAAEKELGVALGRGARVKLGSRAELHRASGIDQP